MLSLTWKQIQRYGLYVQLAVDKLSSACTADCDGYFLFVDTRGGSAGGKVFHIQQKSFFKCFQRPPSRLFSFLYPSPIPSNSELCHVISVNEITGFYHGMSRQTMVFCAIDLLCLSQKNYTVSHAKTHAPAGITNYNPENMFVKTNRFRIVGCLSLVL